MFIMTFVLKGLKNKLYFSYRLLNEFIPNEVKNTNKLLSRFISIFTNFQLPLPGDEVASSVNEMTLLSLHPMSAEPSLSQQQTEKRQSLPSSLPSLAPIQGMETSLKALAEASNITLEALEAAILLRQQQLLRKQQGPTSTSTTTTTTMSPHKK